MSSDLPLKVHAKEFEFEPMLDQLSQDAGEILILLETSWPSSLPPLEQADFKNHAELEKQKKVFLQFNPDGILRNTIPYWNPETFIVENSRPVSPSYYPSNPNSRPVSPSYYPSNPPYGSQTYWDIKDAEEVKKLNILKKRSENLASTPGNSASRRPVYISKGRHFAV